MVKIFDIALLTLGVASASASGLRGDSNDGPQFVNCPDGLNKYYSIDHIFNKCGECCMKDSQYSLYHIFEPGLKKATDNTPCKDSKYGVYKETVTHGFGPVKMSLDMYDPDPTEVAELEASMAVLSSFIETGAVDPAVVKACTADVLKFCKSKILSGEDAIAACMKDHVDDLSPGCLDAVKKAGLIPNEAESLLSGVPSSLMTETEQVEKLEASADGPSYVNCPDGLNKYYSIDTMHNMCGECCMKDSQYPLYHIFERGLKKATDNTPCKDNEYSVFKETVTHGFGPVKMSLDLYNHDAASTQQLLASMQLLEEFVNGDKPIPPEVYKACADDVMKFCADKVGNFDDVKKCMLAHADQLSDKCIDTAKKAGLIPTSLGLF